MANMARLYVGRLSNMANERDVEKFFRGFGRLKDINLKNGFGFVEFDDPRDAEDAVYELNGRELRGERVTIEHARGANRFRDRGDRGGDRYGYGPPRRRGGIDRYGPPVRTEFRVKVDNLSSKVSWQDLKDYMRQAGEVTFADAHKVKENQGTVEFATQYDMDSAIKKLDGTELKGRHISVKADRGSRRSRTRSRSRSRSRKRSRSRSRNKSRSASRSRSRTPKKTRASRSPSPRKSRSRSPTPRKDKSPARSRSRSRSRSRDN